MSAIFSFCNQKGGVGKTTSVVNMAALLGKKGFKVLVIDLDPQANATSGLGIEKPAKIESTVYELLVEKSEPAALIVTTEFSNVSLIPSNPDVSSVEMELYQLERREFYLKTRLETLKSKFDFIFLDCPPSLGMISINALVASDYIVIPLQCEYYALEGLGQLINTYQLVKTNLNPQLEIGGVILTMADSRTNLTQQVIEEVRSYFKEKVFNAIIPRSVKLSEAPSFGKPAVFYDPQNRGSKGYVDVVGEFIKKYGNKKTEEIPHTVAAVEVRVESAQNPEV
ncbi:MAG: ParA family protein [Candidatus Omnitrophica bacterium]|nr:ParA family protein [Candidatus Omnitrophota bacterium]